VSGDGYIVGEYKGGNLVPAEILERFESMPNGQSIPLIILTVRIDTGTCSNVLVVRSQ